MWPFGELMPLLGGGPQHGGPVVMHTLPRHPKAPKWRRGRKCGGKGKRGR